jgi:PD-(D/E)XK nuclease superfamily
VIKRHRLLYGETTILIDNSAANAFRTCPTLYYNQYERNGTGLQHIKYPGEEYNSLELGDRVHQLLEEYYSKTIRYTPSLIEPLELEAQLIVEAYKANYPEEPFKVVDVENTFKIQLPNSHHYLTGKIDLTVIPEDSVNLPHYELDIIDHKTQTRTSKMNSPQKWAMRNQASLYLWAASKIYPENTIRSFWVNALTRPSEKMVKGPSFVEGRQKLERTPEQIHYALRDITLIADLIESYREKFGDKEPWPRNQEACITFGQCEFYMPCLYGWSGEVGQKYEPKTPYLHIIQ